MRLLALPVLGVIASLAACNTTPAAAPTAPVATATPAATPAAAPAATQQVASNDPNQVICIKVENTGSRLPSTRECHTREQWSQIRSTGLDTLGIANAAHLPTTDAGSPTGR